MKEKIGAVVFFLLLAVSAAAGILLTMIDKPDDVYPGDNTMIMLYGERHGEKVYYDAEIELWKGCYDEGCRNLFVELPYYSAEFLNIWMKENSDSTLDKWFEEIAGTASSNEYYRSFFHSIKEKCPETVFFGTDVGHQADTTGARYLAYLEENGLAGSENYRLAQECILQGKEYKADENAHDGMSVVREAYMVSNFIDAYTRCGGGKVMGIYGSYHISLYDPDLMAGRLRAHYGDIIGSLRMSSVLFGRNEPYRAGFCITGTVFLIMLFVPNIIWAKKGKPAGYDEAAKRENKVLLAAERVGEAAVSVSLLIFTAIEPRVMMLPEGLYFEWTMILWITAAVLMIMYECYWIRYFHSSKTMKDLYSSFAGAPVAGASLPVLAVLLLGLYSGNLVIIGASVVLGIGHIGIHIMHRRELQ